MNETQRLAKNLKTYKDAKKLSNCEFAEELNMAESTIRNAMKDGNVTADTLIRISKGLNMSLDMLVYDETMPEKLTIIKILEKFTLLKENLSPAQMDRVANILQEAWEVLKE